jgi:predicted nucleic acid-binding protein
MILVDANVLLRLIQIGHPHQQPALEAIALLHVRDRERLVISPQILFFQLQRFRRVEQAVLLRLRKTHDQQLLLQPAVVLGEEVVAEAAGAVREAAEHQHGPGREIGRNGHVVELPFRPAGLQPQYALITHPTLTRLVVVQLGDEL